MDKVEVLKQTDLFYNLSLEQLQLVAGLAQERRAKKGELIYEEGSDSREVYVLISGSLEVSHKHPHRNAPSSDEAEQVVLATLSRGQSCGEISFVDQARREATVRSLSDDTVMLVINPEALMAQCEANPAMGFFIIRNLAKDLAFIIRELDSHILGSIFWNSSLSGMHSQT
jgi:CRP-like cAMP-binding protein